jgi:hypothetical protein
LQVAAIEEELGVEVERMSELERLNWNLRTQLDAASERVPPPDDLPVLQRVGHLPGPQGRAIAKKDILREASCVSRNHACVEFRSSLSQSLNAALSSLGLRDMQDAFALVHDDLLGSGAYGTVRKGILSSAPMPLEKFRMGVPERAGPNQR